MSSSGFESPYKFFSTVGVRCWLNRQSGFINITRLPNRRLFVTSMAFDPTKKIVPSRLGWWQRDLNYHAPLSKHSGLGPALAYSAINVSSPSDQRYRIDFATFAQNFLYASAEADRIIFGSAGSVSAKTFRQVDATRLVVDCVAGLGKGKDETGDGDMFARLVPKPNEALAKWTEGYCVAYEKVDEDGDVVVRLRRVGDALR